MEEPDTGDIFDQSNGEKVRVEYSAVATYASKDKGKKTVIETGWGDSKATYILAIDFEDFDAKVQANKKAWRDYWDAKYNDSESTSKSLY